MKDKTSLKHKFVLVVFSLFLSVLLIEIGLRLSGFIYLSLQEARNKTSLSQKDVYRIMCLGDSTTAFGDEYSYPSQLEQILQQKLSGKQFSVINKGVPGINTTGILSQLKYNLDKYQPDMVIVMMGINDQEDRFLQRNSLPEIKKFIKSFRIYKLARLFYKRAREVNILAEMYLELAHSYQEQLNYSQAEEMFKKAIELVPHNDEGYIGLGLCYNSEGDFIQAEEMFKKAIELAPKKERVYIYLGWCYNEQGKFIQAEEMFKKAIALNPKTDNGYFQLGTYYREQGNYPQAEEMLKKAIEAAPDKEMAYTELGAYYKEQGKFTQAEEMFKRAIALTPQKATAYIELGWCYQGQKKIAQAEETLKKAIAVNPIVYFELADYYQAHHNHIDAEEMFQKVREIFSTDDYNKITRRNYQKLKDTVLKRGIRLVSMQYPIRSLKPLKEILSPTKGTTFVDNEKVFQEAIEKGKYEDYFTDRFAGDFGHCTPKGNWLIANNISEALLKEDFFSPEF